MNSIYKYDSLLIVILLPFSAQPLYGLIRSDMVRRMLCDRIATGDGELVTAAVCLPDGARHYERAFFHLIHFYLRESVLKYKILLR